jgi:hypothetical protein
MSVPTYAYAANNPLKYIDPNGLWIRDVAPWFQPHLDRMQKTKTGKKVYDRLVKSALPVDFVNGPAGFNPSGKPRRGVAERVPDPKCGPNAKAFRITVDNSSTFWPDDVQYLGTIGHESDHVGQLIDYPNGIPAWLENQFEIDAVETGIDIVNELWP